MKEKKFHIFQEQVKSPQELQREMRKLEEVLEWKNNCKDLEKEKEVLFKEMGQIIQEKERVISHLHNTSSELEDYVTYLEKLSCVQTEYKGKTLSASQNKSRTLKNFLSRAEIGLWFSKSFGLNVETILVKECDTGLKHNLNMKSNCSPSFSPSQDQEQENQSTIPSLKRINSK